MDTNYVLKVSYVSMDLPMGLYLSNEEVKEIRTNITDIQKSNKSASEKLMSLSDLYRKSELMLADKRMNSHTIIANTNPSKS